MPFKLRGAAPAACSLSSFENIALHMYTRPEDRDITFDCLSPPLSLFFSDHTYHFLLEKDIYNNWITNSE